MSMSHAFQSQSIVFDADDKRVPDDLVKQIRKLRWIGLDGEAKLLESALRHMRAADVVLGAPPETD